MLTADGAKTLARQCLRLRTIVFDSFNADDAVVAVRDALGEWVIIWLAPDRWEMIQAFIRDSRSVEKLGLVNVNVNALVLERYRLLYDS